MSITTSQRQNLSQRIQAALQAPCNFILAPMLDPMPRSETRRTAWSRLNGLLSVLKTGEKFTASKLSKVTGYCSKTIHRDIRHLRRSGVVIKYSHERQTYRLEGKIPTNLQDVPNGGKQ